MNILLQSAKNYPLSVLCIALIWFLSLIFTPPHTPLDNVAFIDKWTHFVMYGGTCGVIWWEYLRRHGRPDYRRLFLLAWLAPVVMSGIIELLQEWCTTNRHGDWLDFAANATGATIGSAVGWLMYRFHFSKRHSS